MTSLMTHALQHDTSAPPIHVVGVNVSYNGTTALSDVHVEIPPRARVAVVGPNGAGKTTFLQVIAGTIEPTSGEVNVFGHGPRGHVCIAYVPQRSQVDWSFPVTVQDVVMMGRIRKLGFLQWPRRRDWEIVSAALSQVEMLAHLDTPIGELSGGQQQRVFLAQALAQEAEIVLLDEPLTGLDLPSQETILNLLDDLHGMGITLLVATHDLNLAADRFDQILLLNRRLIAFGSPAQALNQASLLEAYGGHLHLVQGEAGTMIVTDTCCDGEQELHLHE